MFKRLKLWWQIRRAKQLRQRLEDEQMAAVLNATWQSGRAVIGTTDPDGTFRIGFVEEQEEK